MSCVCQVALQTYIPCCFQWWATVCDVGRSLKQHWIINRPWTRRCLWHRYWPWCLSSRGTTQNHPRCWSRPHAAHYWLWCWRPETEEKDNTYYRYCEWWNWPFSSYAQIYIRFQPSQWGSTLVVCRYQILTFKVDFDTVSVKIFLMAVDP